MFKIPDGPEYPLPLGNLAVLSNFYEALKDVGNHIHLVVVTGDTYYGMREVPSGLNYLMDLSMDEDFAEACGLTPVEIRACYEGLYPGIIGKLIAGGELPAGSGPDALEALLLKWYGGYSWDGRTRVLNPWSVNQFFKKSALGAYWGRTGENRALLSSILGDDPFALLRESGGRVLGDVLTTAELGTISPKAALFQTGYLTFNGFTKDQKRRKLYSLKVPNIEIERIISIALPYAFDMYRFRDLARSLGPERNSVIEAAAAGDPGRLTVALNSLYASFSAVFHTEEPSERFYHSVLASVFWYSGEVTVDADQSVGQPDIVFKPISHYRLVMVIELNFGKPDSDKPDSDNPGSEKPGSEKPGSEKPGSEKPGSMVKKAEAIAGYRAHAKTLAENALNTIYDKDYLGPHRDGARKLIPIGVGVYGRGFCHAVIGDPSGPAVPGPGSPAQSSGGLGEAPAGTAGKPPA
jgi:hypothetical protein